jgi:hypothetical protein
MTPCRLVSSYQHLEASPRVGNYHLARGHIPEGLDLQEHTRLYWYVMVTVLLLSQYMNKMTRKCDARGERKNVHSISVGKFSN